MVTKIFITLFLFSSVMFGQIKNEKKIPISDTLTIFKKNSTDYKKEIDKIWKNSSLTKQQEQFIIDLAIIIYEQRKKQ